MYIRLVTSFYSTFHQKWNARCYVPLNGLVEDIKCSSLTPPLTAALNRRKLRAAKPGILRPYHSNTMNTRILLTIALTTLPLRFAFSQVLPQVPQISVSGSAEVKVAPDEIHLSVGVETRHENLEEAKRQNDERVSNALSFLKRSGVKDKDVQTDFLGVEPAYDNEVSRTKPVAYLVQKSIGIRLTKVSTFEAVLTGLLTHGVNYVHGIDFRTSELRKHRDTARAMAIQAAKEKADALASQLGVKRGKVYSISENYWGGWWSWSGSYWRSRGGGGMQQNVAQNAGGASDAAEGALSVGQISVSAIVNVSFLIE